DASTAAASRPQPAEGVDRAMLALAEAIIPGTSTIPGADDNTVREVTELLSRVSPKLARAWTSAHRALDAAARLRTGRPFHALSAARQDALLARWERDPLFKTPLGLLASVYKVLHFDAPHVQRAMGARPRPPLPVTEPRWAQQVQAAASWTAGDVECDVVVIGTGAGGAVVGHALAERGHAVVFAEEGQLYHRHDFDGSIVRAYERFYRPAFSLGNASMPVMVGRMVGGSTAVNGGTAFRTPSWVLDRWCEEMGTDAFSPSRMEPYFERVEAHLGVAPASLRYTGPVAGVMQRGCDALGWKHGQLIRNAPACEASGFCHLGCRSDARRSTNLSYLPPALERGAALFTGLKVERVVVEAGRAVGVQGRAANGVQIRVRARAVILAGGSIPTPLFLLKQDLANASGQVGRNLTLHPSGVVSGLFDEEIRGFDHIPQGYGSEEFLREGLLLLAAQGSHNAMATLFPGTGRRLMEPLAQLRHVAAVGPLAADATRNGRVWGEFRGLPVIRYTVTPADVARLKRGLELSMDMLVAAGARRLYPGVFGHDGLDPRHGLERFRKTELSASDIALASYHPLGTCQMGTDPRSSVVGLDHQSHDVPGLFIVDGSTVRGPLGVNPQLTIMAVAARAADQISPQLG
ncbi:MAG TPA: GMC family oxidoreductase N-terminal domain-containing protein, partial [Myxococcaceae bacterium]|nr:GMC family oxidoreductase N-terminal domain-containing protein [Myxococcaceae bacterium]